MLSRLTLHAANYLSFDILSDVTFSVKRHLIETPEYWWITYCIESMMHRIGVVSVSISPLPRYHAPGDPDRRLRATLTPIFRWFLGRDGGE